jgi:hypothetical protein
LIGFSEYSTTIFRKENREILSVPARHPEISTSINKVIAPENLITGNRKKEQETAIGPEADRYRISPLLRRFSSLPQQYLNNVF